MINKSQKRGNVQRVSSDQEFLDGDLTLEGQVRCALRARCGDWIVCAESEGSAQCPLFASGVLEDGLTTGSHLAMATVATCQAAEKSKMTTDTGGSRQETLDRSPGEWNKAWVARAGRPVTFHLHCAAWTTGDAGKTQCDIARGSA